MFKSSKKQLVQRGWLKRQKKKKKWNNAWIGNLRSGDRGRRKPRTQVDKQLAQGKRASFPLKTEVKVAY